MQIKYVTVCFDMKIQDLFQDIFYLIACQKFDERRKFRFKLTVSTPIKIDLIKH